MSTQRGLSNRTGSRCLIEYLHFPFHSQSYTLKYQYSNITLLFEIAVSSFNHQRTRTTMMSKCQLQQGSGYYDKGPSWGASSVLGTYQRGYHAWHSSTLKKGVISIINIFILR